MHSWILHGTLPIYGARLENMLLVENAPRYLQFILLLVTKVLHLAEHEWLLVAPPNLVTWTNKTWKKHWMIFMSGFQKYSKSRMIKTLVFHGQIWTFLLNPGKAYSTHPGNRTVSTKNLEVTRLLHRVPQNRAPTSWVNYHHPCLRIATASPYQMLVKKDSWSALNLLLMGKF